MTLKNETENVRDFFAAIGLAVLAIPFVLVLAPLILMWRAWWLYPAWSWFVVPLGVPAIAFWHFIALMLFASSVAWSKTEHRKDERPIDWGKVVSAIIWPILVWVLLRWMR